MPKEPIQVSWTISSAASVSGGIGLNAHQLFGIGTPPTWDTNQDLGLQGALEDPHQDHLTANWEDITDREGNQIRFTGVEADKIMTIDPNLTVNVRQIRFVSLDANGDAEVVAADRAGVALLARMEA